MSRLQVRWYYNQEEQDFTDEDIDFKAVMHKLQVPGAQGGPRCSDAQRSDTSAPQLVAACFRCLKIERRAQMHPRSDQLTSDISVSMMMVQTMRLNAGGRWHKPAKVQPSSGLSQTEGTRDVEVPTNLELGPAQGLIWDRYRLIGIQPEGSYFGEHTCLLGEKRVATVVTCSFSELNSLSRLSLEKMAQQWPELIDEILLLLDGCVEPQHAVALSPLCFRDHVACAAERPAFVATQHAIIICSMYLYVHKQLSFDRHDHAAGPRWSM